MAAVGAAVLAVLAVLAVCGIAVGSGSLRHVGAPAATPAPTPTASALSQVFTGVVPGTMHVYSSARTPPACALAQLRTESRQDGKVQGPSYFQSVWFWNAGDDCLINGMTLRIGGTPVTIDDGESDSGGVIPARGAGDLVVSTPRGCVTSPGASTAASDLAIQVRLGGATRTMAARFPRSGCTSPQVDLQDFADAAAHAAPSEHPLRVDISEPVISWPGPVHYQVTIRNTASTALVLTSCPRATEVVTDFSGLVVTRALTLACRTGATLQPGAASVLSVATAPVGGAAGRHPKGGEIFWFADADSSGVAPSTTCKASRLRFSAPESSGSDAATWTQRIAISNSGPGCSIPDSAFSVGSAVVSGPAGAPGVVQVPSGASTVVVQTLHCSAATPPPGAGGPVGPFIFVSLAGGTSDGIASFPYPFARCGGFAVRRS